MVSFTLADTSAVGNTFLSLVNPYSSSSNFAEGSLTSFMALLSLIWLPAEPSTARFLSKQEKLFAARRMQVDYALSEETAITKRDISETLKDWKLWYVLIVNILASVPPQAFGVFLPLVVKGLGYSGVHSNLMSVPPYLFGALGLYLFAFSSDRLYLPFIRL